MGKFNEKNTVEQRVLDTLCGGVTSSRVADEMLYRLRTNSTRGSN